MAAYSSAMDQALSLINAQSANLNSYFDTANADFETQYNSFYGQTMQDAFNALSNTGIYDSPVSENALNRKRTSLAQTYATGKSTLAGQKLSAESSIDQQKVGYYQNLANLQYQNTQAKQQSKNQLYSTIGSVGAALIL